MWVIFKTKTSKENFFKKNIKDLYGDSVTFFSPKYKTSVYSKNKFKFKIKNLIPNHIFIFFNEANLNYKNLKFIKGSNFVYENFLNNQKDITNFINHCKNFEDDEGYLKINFFTNLKVLREKFKSGLLANFFFEIIGEKKNDLKILIDNKRMTISKQSFINCNPF